MSERYRRKVTLILPLNIEMEHFIGIINTALAECKEQYVECAFWDWHKDCLAEVRHWCDDYSLERIRGIEEEKKGEFLIEFKLNDSAKT